MDIKKVETRARLTAFIDRKLKKEQCTKEQYEANFYRLMMCMAKEGETIDTLVNELIRGEEEDGISIDDQFEMVEFMKLM